VGTTVVVARGPYLALVDLSPGAPVRTVPLGSDPERAASGFQDLAPSALPPALTDAIRASPATARWAASDERLARALTARSGRRCEEAGLAELRRARAIAWDPERSDDRDFALAFARRSLERALRSPEQTLIALAREEERFERARGREDRAAAAFLPVPGTPLDVYADAWRSVRKELDAHHTRLEHLLEDGARALAPNLAAVVGPKVAARLVAAAGGLGPLARMTGSRVQLLGSHRRPSPERGPRYGLLYRGARADDVPLDRRGAYARSLAALAVIAARADAYTHRTLAEDLVARRDRRVDALRRRRA
jgi:hypothetical protein